MPITPSPLAVPHVWRWRTLFDIAERSGRLVPVGRGGERRAIGLVNPGLPGTAYVTPTLWAAIQYLGGHETAPEHCHSQNAFRFVVEGEGVWTVVNGDPVAMAARRPLAGPGVELPRSPQRHAEPDGLDRRARHPAVELHRRRLLGVRRRPRDRRGVTVGVPTGP
jgi:gentisate 1,2-dioxygenase